jgi:hypothetical protein
MIQIQRVAAQAHPDKVTLAGIAPHNTFFTQWL